MEINLCYGCMSPREGDGPCPHCGFDENTYQPALHHLPPGTALAGKYLLGPVLGEGGFGITYVGWDLNLEMKIAIKEYFPNGFVTRNSGYDKTVTVLTGQKGDFFQRGLDKFVDEARRLGKFWGLPGIVSVKDYFQENKTGYIVMEFAQGQTLKNILKNTPDGRLSADQVFEMMKPVMKSLEKVHKAGLIHRDISPDNLMVDQEPDGSLTVKLIDFGAARDFMAEGERSLSVMLKPGYAPEEQYRSRGKQGPWTDVYGLCATMYRAITGKVPDESLDRMEEDPLERPSQLGVNIENWQEDALMKGLAVFQKNRFQSMEELEAAMYASAAGPEQKTQPEPQPEPEPAPGPETMKENLSDGKTKEDEPEETAAEESVSEASPVKEKHEPQNSEKSEETDHRHPKTENKLKWIAAAAAAVVLLFFVIYSFTGGNSGTKEDQVAFQEESSETADNGNDQRQTRTSETEMWETAAAQTETVETEEIRQEAESGISQETEVAPETETIQETQPREAVIWSDAQMERLVRKALGRAEGDIYTDELAQIQVLRINGDAIEMYKSSSLGSGPLIPEAKTAGDIQSLSDLAYFPNLVTLEISGHGISDISIIANLTSLTTLELTYDNISDISPLSGLTSLTYLSLRMNRISDVSPLSGLTGLEYLDFYGNNVSDISSLSGLTALKELYIGANNVTDLSVLDNFPDLEHMYNGN